MNTQKVTKILALIFMLPLFINGQIIVDDTPTGVQLAQLLAGSNITVTNVSYTGSPIASGSFTTNGNFPFSSGIILSTGDVNTAPGPNNDPNTSDNLGTAGTAEMDALGGANSSDVVTLQFDFVVQSASIQFDYIFGSEEYPEFAPPNQPSFNDVFAFYISGPGIVGEENIAIIPGTTLPVTIDNVNPVTNSQYYVDNTNGTEVQVDGYTTPMMAFKDGLIPCETYTMRLVISDIQTANRNSSVFLEENSFVQEDVLDVQTQTVNTDGIAIEGCVPATFGFNLLQPSGSATTFTYQIGGTATNGVDYQFIDTMVTIPAGQTSANIVINSISDGIPEGQEVIYIIYSPDACTSVDTAFLYIDDAQPIEFTLDGTNLNCFGNNSGEILVNASGGFPNYTYSVTTDAGAGVTTQYTNNPITGLEAGQYSVQVYDIYGCKAEALVIGGVFDADTTFLPDGSGVSYTSEIPISGFDTGETLNSMSQLQQVCATMEHSYLGDLQIKIISPSGQQVILKEFNGGGSCDLGEPFASGPVDGQNSNLTDPGVGYEYCWNASPVYLTMVQESNNYTHTIPASTGGTYTDKYLPQGSYESFEDLTGLLGSSLNGNWTLEVSDQFGLDNGYIFNWNISLNSGLPDTLITIIEPNAIAINGFITQAQCGGTDGAIDLSVSGDFPPYSFAWSSGQTTEDISGISAGIYSVVVTDANGCQDSATFNLNNISSINTLSTITSVTCDGGTNGAIDVSTSGGTSPYTFSWNTGATTEDISGVEAGLYTLNITDDAGCIYSEDFEISTLPELQISLINSTNEVCGAGNGSININVSGGSGSYAYAWDNGATTEDISNLSQGNYEISVVDANNCLAVDTISIFNDVSSCSSFCYLNISTENIVDEMCGDGTGALDITVLDAVYPYQVSWSNGATTDDISGLNAGTYTITVLDANQCEVSSNIVVGNESGSLAISNSSIINENCGNADGGVNITVTGGTSPYSYLWSNGNTSEDLSGVVAGTYSVTVTDNVGCSTSQSFTIVNSTGTLSVSAVVSDENCSNSGGFIDVTVSGGTQPVNYSWSNGSSSEDIYVLSAGDYYLSVVDNSGCTLTSPIYTIENNPGSLQILSSNIVNEACGDGTGSIDVTMLGGVLPYSFLWSTGSTTEDITGLSAGSYNLTVTDDNGCQLNSGTYTVFNSPGNLSAFTNSSTAEVCGDSTGQLDIEVVGGAAPYNFSWDNGAITEDISGLTAGVYILTITDANGCEYGHTDEVISVSPGFSSSVAVVVDEFCGDASGSIDIDVIGGTLPITYLWNNSATTEDISGLTAGTYDLVITDSNGCELYESAIIEGEGIVISGAAISDELCGNGSGSIDISFSGGLSPYTFSWSNGMATEDITGLSAGIFTLEITDANGCLATETYSVNNNTSGLSASLTNVTDEICGDGNGAIDVTTIGGNTPLQYSWSNGATTEDLSGLSAGSYTLTVSDINGCTTDVSGTVVNNSSGFSASINSITDEVCGDGTGAINIDVTGGLLPYIFTWNNGATTEDISGISAGNYEVTITDNNGCSIMVQGVVGNITGTLAVANDVVGDASCTSLNGYIDLTISGGAAPYTYAWDNGATTEDIAGVAPGTYNCVITDNAGCIVNYTGTVNSTGGLITTNTNIVNEICGNNEGQINVTVTGGISPFTYSWTGASPSNCCDYTLDMFDASTSWNGATVTVLLDGISIGNFTVFGGGANQETFTACDGQSIELIWSQGQFDNEVSFNLLDPSGTIIFAQGPSPTPGSLFTTTGTCPAGAPDETSVSNLSAGIYQLTITDNVGCELTESYTVQNTPSTMQLVITSINDDQCLQNQGQIQATSTGGTSPLEYTLDGTPDAFFPGQFNNLSTGDYLLMVVDANGCEDTTTVSVGNQASFTTSIVSVTDENCGFADGTIDIETAGIGTNFSYTWSNGQTTQDLSGLTAGTYTCTISDLDNFCNDNISVDVMYNTGFDLSSVSSDENCGDGSGLIDLTITGGTMPFAISWSNGATTEDISNLSAGEYTVQVTDNFGCFVELTDTILNNTGSLTVSGVITNENCANNLGAIDIMVTGGSLPYTYLWSNAATTEDISNLVAGNYTCQVTDNSGCTIVYTGDVMDDFGGMSTDTIIVNETCGNANGSIEVTVNGGVSPYTYSWTGAAPDTCCVYTLDLIDTFGDGWDGAFLTVLIDGASIGNFTVAVSQDNFEIAICNGQSIELVYTPGNWETEHTYSLLDPQGNVLFADGPSPTSGSVYNSVGNCSGPNDQTAITGLSAGTYDLTVTDNTGCSLTQSYSVVNEPSTLSLSVTSINDDQCLQSTGQVQSTATGGFAPLEFTLDGQPAAFNGNFFGVLAGDYILMVEDANGCQESLNITVGNQSTFTTSIVSVVDENCGNMDGSIDIDVVGASTNFGYSWNNGATTQDLSGLSAGTYTCVITDIDNACDDNVEVIISNTADFTVQSTVTDENCGDGFGAIDITVTGGSSLTFNWDNGATTEDLSGLSAGTYSCIITDGTTGCSFTETVNVSNNTGGLTVSSSSTDESCGDSAGAINISVSGGSGNYSYLWSSGEVTQDLSNIPAGTYTLVVTDNTNGCQVTEVVTVVNDANFTISGIVNNSTCSTCTEGSIDVSIGEIIPDGPYTYAWDNGATTQDITGLVPGTYSVVVTGASGCSATMEFTIENTVGVVNIVNEMIVNVYPNPSSGLLTVELNSNSTNGTITVLDAIGKLVKQKTINSSTQVVNLSEQERGVYFLQVENNGNKQTIKVVLH